MGDGQINIVQTHPHLATEWHDERSVLYHAPAALLDRLDRGEINRSQIEQHTRKLFMRCRLRSAEWPLPAADLAGGNPNALNPRDEHEDIKPWQEDLMASAIRCRYELWVPALIEAGWEPSAHYEAGCAGLMGWAVRHFSADGCRLLKAQCDAKGWALDLDTPAAAFEGASAKQVRRHYPNSLFDAIDSGDAEKLALLLQWGVDPYVKGRNSGTLMERVIRPSQTTGLKHALLITLAEHGIIRIRPDILEGTDKVGLYCVDHTGKSEAILPPDKRRALLAWHSEQVKAFEQWTAQSVAAGEPLNIDAAMLKRYYGAGLLSACCHHPVWLGHEAQLFALYAQLPAPIASEIEKVAMDVLVRGAAAVDVHTPLYHQGRLSDVLGHSKGRP